MKIDSRKILNKIQTITGTRKSELIFIAIVFLGISIGAIYQNYYNPENNSKSNEIIRLADSLQKAENDSLKIALSDSTDEEKKEKSEKVLKIGKELPIQVININIAVKHELMKIPGIGEKSAENIIKYRINSPFEKIEDIKNIKGIGEKKFEKIKGYIKIK